jgi:hypothetical protein
MGDMPREPEIKQEILDRLHEVLSGPQHELDVAIVIRKTEHVAQTWWQRFLDIVPESRITVFEHPTRQKAKTSPGSTRSFSVNIDPVDWFVDDLMINQEILGFRYYQGDILVAEVPLQRPQPVFASKGDTITIGPYNGTFLEVLE